MDAFLDGGADFLGVVLDVAFYGLHIGIYLLFLVLQRERGSKIFRGFAHFASSISFVLSTLFVIFNIICIYFEMTGQTDAHQVAVMKMSNGSSSIYALIDILAQALLLYRCWIIWDKRYYVVAFPILLAVGSLWLNLVGVIIPSVTAEDSLNFLTLTDIATTAYASSMAVNAIVSILIAARIWFLSRKFAELTEGRTNRPYNIIISMLLETGVTIFIAQTAWLVLYQINSPGYSVITGAVTQVYGFTPTVILIRVALADPYKETVDLRMSKSIAFNNFQADTVSYGEKSTDNSNTTGIREESSSGFIGPTEIFTE